MSPELGPVCSSVNMLCVFVLVSYAEYPVSVCLLDFLQRRNNPSLSKANVKLHVIVYG